VIVRSTEFPAGRTAKVNAQIAKLVQRGGKRVVVEDADWRKLAAFRAFRKDHAKQPEFADWLRDGQPLTQLASLRQILDLDDWLKAKPLPAGDGAPKAPTAPAPVIPPVADAGALLLGTRAGLTGGAVTLTPQELTYHSAFLGGTGSGKTTAALNLIEQLLERGIPAVLLDRKGDLCRYADPAAWQRPLADPQQTTRRQRLRERLQIALYTPGEPSGRPLTIPLMPEGVDQMPTLEREQLAGFAAAGLAGMMGLKNRGVDLSLQAILRKAIEVLDA